MGPHNVPRLNTYICFKSRTKPTWQFRIGFFYDAQCGYIFFIGKFFDTIAKNTDQTSYITCYTFKKTVKKNLTYTIKNADNILSNVHLAFIFVGRWRESCKNYFPRDFKLYLLMKKKNTCFFFTFIIHVCVHKFLIR